MDRTVRCRARMAVTVAAAVAWLAVDVCAQPLGTFGWQLQPFCNRVTVNVTQNGAVYTLDGFDDQCGAAERAALVGLATPNADGTISFGLNAVVPGGQPVHIEARITFPALSGTWHDSAGNSGVFAFGANTGGGPRPAPVVGDVTGIVAGVGLSGGGAGGEVSLAVDASAVQSRVTGACAAGQAVRTVNQDGSVACEPVGEAGSITGISPGPGLTGGGTSGDVALAVVFGGDGTTDEAARANHRHAQGNNVAVGTGALSVNAGAHNTGVGTFALGAVTSGVSNTAIGSFALDSLQTSSNNTAVGAQALDKNTASGNTAVGMQALRDTTTGTANVAVGLGALFTNVSGAENVGVGALAGVAHTGNASTFLGTGSSTTLLGISNATAIGSYSQVDQNDSMVLGSINGVNGAAASTKVGIGTTTPNAALEIDHKVGSVPTLQLTRYSSLVNGPIDVSLHRSMGTESSPAPVSSGAEMAKVWFRGWDGGTFRAASFLRVSSAELWSPTAHGNKLEYFVETDAGPMVNAFTIAADAQVGIGTASPARKLDVAGNVRIGTGTTGCVEDRDTTMIAGTACSSDYRLKRDITSFAPALTRVAALRPVHFFWRADEFPDRHFGARQSYGLVAQEVEAVLPELVSTDEDGYKAVNYSKLPLLAIQAIKELKEQNDALRASHAALAERLAAIEARLATSQR